jgi:acyl-CoA synthetase (AMP-forming)/AMP-acid ligase II
MTNAYFLHSGDWYRDAGGLIGLAADAERMITPLPVFHMNAMAVSVMAMVTVGGCLTMLDRFHPRSWWDCVRASRATCLHYLGVMPSMLMSAQPSELDRLHASGSVSAPAWTRRCTRGSKRVLAFRCSRPGR